MNSVRIPLLSLWFCCSLLGLTHSPVLLAADAPKISKNAPDLSSKIGKKCIVYYNESGTSTEEGVLVKFDDKWLVLNQAHGEEESVEAWILMTDIRRLYFTNFKTK